jgi:hypothetical protein
VSACLTHSKRVSQLHPFRDRAGRVQLARRTRSADDIERNSGSREGGGQVLLGLLASAGYNR